MSFSCHRLRWIAAALIVVLIARPALAADSLIVRDAEVEADIRTMVGSIWRVAGLDPNEVAIYLIQDNQINSFVAGGQAVFINTGLILKSETPNELIGVIAHETGHIAGGHVVRAKEAMHNAMVESVIAMVAGAAIGALGRNSAPVLAAGGVGERSFMKFSISQEAAADHAAMSYLDKTQQSARGLLKLFGTMQSQELMSGERQDPWMRTHPFTSERIQYVRHHVETSRYSDVPDTAANIELLKTIKMKIKAFFEDPQTTLSAYPETDKSVAARYARAIAYYRIPKLDRALPIIDGLIREFPNNPYYRELKGQMLFENGRVRDAIQPYEDAVKLAPRAPLLRISLSQVYIESGDASLNKKAIAYLNDASRVEGKESQVWKFLAVAYGRDNQMGMAALSLAEAALTGGKKKDAQQQATRAKQLLPKNQASYLRADEIHREAEHIDD